MIRRQLSSRIAADAGHRPRLRDVDAVAVHTGTWPAVLYYCSLRLPAAACNMAIYLKTRNFYLFRHTQLGLFLFMPFAGTVEHRVFITASGVSLWGLAGPDRRQISPRRTRIDRLVRRRYLQLPPCRVSSTLTSPTRC